MSHPPVAAALLAGLWLAAGQAAAAQAPDAPVAAGPSVAQQIDDYLKSSPAAELPKDAAPGVTSSAPEPRKVHGVVDVAVGSQGYRSAYMRTDLPVGQTGTLSIAVGETRSDGRSVGRYYNAGAYDRRSVAVGLALGDAAQTDQRCRRVWDDGQPPMRDPRLLDGRPDRACPAGPPLP